MTRLDRETGTISNANTLGKLMRDRLERIIMGFPERIVGTMTASSRERERLLGVL